MTQTTCTSNTSNQNEEHMELVRKLGAEKAVDANKIEETLHNWCRSERFDEQELAESLFRTLIEAGIEKRIAETLTDDFAFRIDPRFVR